jgi:hypothetical protein
MLCEIRDTLSLDQEGHATPLGIALYGSGHFYRADGAFSYNRTCNSWTIELLQAAGCNVAFTRYASSVMKQLYELP